MIVGLGADLCRIDRIERAVDRFGERFLCRVFTEAEVGWCRAGIAGRGAEPGERRVMAACLAKRFAAKEALVKALGTGFRSGIRWREMEVVRDPLGKPTLLVSVVAGQCLSALGEGVLVHLTLSDEAGLALAVVILSRSDQRL